MKLKYSIWFWGNGSFTSGIIEARHSYLARRKLNKMLKYGFRCEIGFYIEPQTITRVAMEILD